MTPPATCRIGRTRGEISNIGSALPRRAPQRQSTPHHDGGRSASAAHLMALCVAYRGEMHHYVIVAGIDTVYEFLAQDWRCTPRGVGEPVLPRTVSALVTAGDDDHREWVPPDPLPCAWSEQPGAGYRHQNRTALAG
jgi:hypothetical protein